MASQHRSRRMLLALALLGLLMAASPAGAALMAVDLGADFLKISVVKPGRIPISIVNNEMSKRKSPAAVAFLENDRLLGDEAAAISVRYPDKVFTRLRDLLGRRHDHPAVARVLKDSHLPFSVVPAPNRTTVAFAVGNGEVYTIEEAVASLLEYAKSLATTAAEGSPITECVLVVPAFFGPAQRQALLDAADLAGLKVLSLVHAHAAAALQYGIERDFANHTDQVLFVDIGAGAAQAALVKFSAFQGAGKDAAPISQLEVQDVAWVEHGVGGDALEATLLRHFAAQHAGGADKVLSSPRAVEKLRKQVKRVKTVLSANTEAPISVEDLLPGEDFRGRITREEFEDLAGNVWERSVAPVTEILKRNNLTGADLAAVELLGGSSRVPRVKGALTEALGGRALDMHLDADEAVVLGAGLVAANLSTIFRLRKFGMTDKVPYTVTFRLDGAAEQGAEGSEAPAPAEDRVLVPALKKVPTRRAIALHNLTTDSFSVELKLDNSAGAVLPCCQRRDPLGAFTVSGIAAVVEKYGSSGKVALHTAVDQSGVFKLDKADATVEVDAAIPEPAAETNTTTPEGTAESNTTTDAAAGDKPKAEKEDEKKKEEEPAQPAAPTQGKKRTTRVPLNVTGSLALPGLSTEQMAAARRTLRALRERDNAKRETAKARNDLESYIISTRDKLESREDLQAASTEEERDGLRSALADAEDWLYGDGDSASAAEYRAKLKALRKGGDAIEERAAEAEARPKVTKAALDFVELALKAANAWPTIKPWLNETEVEAAVKSIEEFRDWVKTSMEAQEKKKPHEDPAFTTRELARRMDATRRVFTRLNNKPKPVVKPPPAPVDEKNGTTAGNGTEAKPETIPEGDAEEGAAADGGAEAGTEGAGKPAAAGEEKGEADAKEHDEL